MNLVQLKISGSQLLHSQDLCFCLIIMSGEWIIEFYMTTRRVEFINSFTRLHFFNV